MLSSQCSFGRRKTKQETETSEPGCSDSSSPTAMSGLPSALHWEKSAHPHYLVASMSLKAQRLSPLRKLAHLINMNDWRFQQGSGTVSTVGMNNLDGTVTLVEFTAKCDFSPFRFELSFNYRIIFSVSQFHWHWSYYRCNDCTTFTWLFEQMCNQSWFPASLQRFQHTCVHLINTVRTTRGCFVCAVKAAGSATRYSFQ